MKSTLFNKLKTSLTKTKENLVANLEKIGLKNVAFDETLFEEIEETLILADVSISTTQKIIQRLKEDKQKGLLKNTDDLFKFVKQEISLILNKNGTSDSLFHNKLNLPHIILLLGVNGVGKTTTIAKLANLYKQNNYNILLAAADTYRAAAIDQLDIWGKRIGVDVIKHKHGADPSAVVFDALQAAKARNIDTLLIDTAGRQHTKVNLIEELKKMSRVITNNVGTPAHERLLIIDSTTGQNSIQQVEQFNTAIGLTGIIMTKLDGTAKGGSIISIADKFNLPIKMITMGEKIEDIYEFKPKEFVDALFCVP